ncbi:MAG: hypothetical protein GYA24_12385 [Candidatus Lokiarchaeota archaeon]|nr:hypothetical protein [Candidatus Lokiarchaeota archaeon]
MDQLTFKRTSCLVAMAGCIQFVVLTIIAMLLYPGGKHGNIDTTGYDFLENFFSDLGGTVTPTNLPNPVSSILFFVALLAIGVMVMPFLLVVPSLFTASKVSRNIAWLGTVAGLISAAAFIGVAFTPWNLYMLEHVISVQVAFIGLIPLALFYLLAAIAAKERVLQVRYMVLLVEFLVAAIGYVILLFNAPGINTPAGLLINALGQKLIVYNSIIVVAFLAHGCFESLRTA